jgi:hypothetical protein
VIAVIGVIARDLKSATNDQKLDEICHPEGPMDPEGPVKGGEHAKTG